MRSANPVVTHQERAAFDATPGGSTLIEVRIEYPSKEVRDAVLGSGMIDGMEASYARLEAVAQLS